MHHRNKLEDVFRPEYTHLTIEDANEFLKANSAIVKERKENMILMPFLYEMMPALQAMMPAIELRIFKNDALRILKKLEKLSLNDRRDIKEFHDTLVEFVNEN